MHVKFLNNEITAEAEPQSFKEGGIYELVEPSARRWIRMGSAIEVEKPKKGRRQSKKTRPA